MELKIRLTPEAVKAIYRSAFTGPKCRTVCKPIVFGEKNVPLMSISGDFINGPIQFLTSYAVTNNKSLLDVVDVAWAYCLDHINMVRVGESIFQNTGFADQYFEKLRVRGFVLDQPSLFYYLYSCVGKAGKVVEIVDGLATVETNHCYLRGVVIPEGVKGSIVVVHFATAILALSAKEAEQISTKQDQNPWFSALAASLSGDIDYTDFCGGNLSRYVESNLKMLR